MATKRYIVALKEGVDYNAFWSEIENASPEDGFVPSRRVNIVNNRSAYVRLCEYALSDEEATTLIKDPRVLAVECPVRDLPFVKIVSNAVTQNNNFSLTGLSDGDNVNWGLIRHSMSTNAYKNDRFIEEKYKYELTGEGVDIVISDRGVMPNHPEWWQVGAVFDGTSLEVPPSRFQTIGWNTYYSDYVDSQYPSNDDNGHGTFVAGIAAGRTYGWAKKAHIYSLSYGDFSSARSADPIDSFEALIQWHKAKTNNRPTVMNMSWSFVVDYNAVKDEFPGLLAAKWQSYISHLYWRGVPFPGFNDPKHPVAVTGANIYEYYQDRGIIDSTTDIPGQLQGRQGINLPYLSDAYNAALAEVIDAGIIVVQAAGNASFRIEKYTGSSMDNYSSGHDWNNSFYYKIFTGSDHNQNNISEDKQPYPTATRIFFSRGASPTDPRAIMVGALGQDGTEGVKTSDGKQVPKGDRIASFTQRGPRIDVFAAGVNIVSATSGNSGSVTKKPYQHGPAEAFQDNLSGTSFATPQVTGMIALRLEQQPLPDIKAKTNSATMQSWVIANSIKGIIFDPSTKARIQETVDPTNQVGIGYAIPGSVNYSNRLALLGAPNRIAYINTTGQGQTKTIAGSFKVGESYIIASVGTTDYTLIGAANNIVGTTFTATGPGTGTGTASRIDLPPPVKYRLTVRCDGGNGRGQVTSDPAGIIFDSGQVDTYFDFTPETMVTLTSTPSAADSIWSGWLGDINTIFVDPTATSVTVKMDQDRSITASFVLQSDEVLPAGTIVSQGCVPGTYLYREVRAQGGPAYLTYNVDIPNSTQCGFVPGTGITPINYNAVRDGDFTNFLASGQFVGWIGDITVDNLKISTSQKASFLTNTQLVSKIVTIPDYIVSLGYEFYGNQQEQLISYLTNTVLGGLIDELNVVIDNFIGSTVAVAMLSLASKILPSSNALIITDENKVYSRATNASAQAQLQIKKSQSANAISELYPLVREELSNSSNNWAYEGDLYGMQLTEEQLDEIQFRLNEVIDQLFVLVSSISDSVDLYGFLEESTAPAVPPTAPMIVDIAVAGGTQ